MTALNQVRITNHLDADTAIARSYQAINDTSVVDPERGNLDAVTGLSAVDHSQHVAQDLTPKCANAQVPQGRNQRRVALELADASAATESVTTRSTPKALNAMNVSTSLTERT